MALLIGATAWVSLNVTRLPGEVSAVWVSSGIFAGWLLSRRTALWPGYVGAGFAAELAVRLLSGDSVGSGFAFSAFNLLEVLIVAGVVRRLVPDVGNPTRWLGLGGIATSSTLAACAVSGLLASAVVSATSHTPFLTTFLVWYSAHVVGMVIVATLTLVAHRKGIGLSDVPGRRWAFLGDMLLIATVCGLVFYQSAYPLLFLVYPPLLYGVFRHRFAGVVVGISLLAIIGGIATALGHGPLALVNESNLVQRTILLQLFVGTACLMSFPVALSMAERARLTARVRESEQRYRMLADYSHDVVVRMRADGQRLYVSPSSRDVLGWEPAELLQPNQVLVHPEDYAVQQQTIASVLASGHPVTAIYRLRHKEGHYVWMEAAARPIPSADGDTTDIIFAGRDVSQRVAAEQALKASRDELEAQAHLDSLTGLANRRQFDERLTHALGRSRRQGLAVALMYMDIDHFKQVNDTHGHAAGDEVLRVFGQRLSACVRAGDLVARLGGDEFVVLIEDLSAPETAEAIAGKLIEAMSEDIVVEGTTLHVTTSIGIAYSAHPAVAKNLTAAADAALYAAKSAGRNTWQLLPTDDPANRH
ncbi:PAS domain S-box-containing protein/diguanylate cyclase (GGDEF) domain-containing protein [Pseudoxanthomonas sp. CF125]|nr:PAS domain S-box-containing protein/diguanylate cyclase (GGDEF) domain-containing protein [Pseudoxanthomonas sp. CF125]